MRCLVSSWVVALTAAPLAHAEDIQPQPDRVERPAALPSSDVQRPWLYNDDPTIPSPLHVVAGVSNTYSGNDRSVSRPFASADDGPGAKLAFHAQVGLVRMLAFDVTGVAGLFGANDCDSCQTGLHGQVGGGLMAGLRFAPLDGSRSPVRVAVAAGYLMDLDQTNGMYARVTATFEVGRLRLAAMAHAEHVYRDGSDPVDLMATLGASVRVLPQLRLNVEYIVQDVEEAWASGASDGSDTAPVPGRAEGGVHQFVGVGGAIELLQHRLFLNVGPALAFRPELGQVGPVGRAAVTYSF